MSARWGPALLPASGAALGWFWIGTAGWAAAGLYLWWLLVLSMAAAFLPVPRPGMTAGLTAR